MWSDTQLSVLNGVMDEIIPPSSDGSIPGGGALDVAEFILAAQPYAKNPIKAVEQILLALEDRAPAFLSLEKAQRVLVLRSIELEYPDAFATLVRLTYMGYYSRPDTRPFFGVGVHAIHPQGYDVPQESAALIDSLTAPVRARGQAYRDPDESQGGSEQ